MKLNPTTVGTLTNYFDQIGLLPANARQYLREMTDDQFVFHEQLQAADSIHLHIKVADVADLPENQIRQWGGESQNAKEGYIKYAFQDGLNFIFSSIPVSQEEKAGIASFSFPHLDHIGIDIRDESEKAYQIFNDIPSVAASQEWPSKKQGGDGKKVYCCHVQVNEKYWVYPANGVFWEFAFGKLLVSEDVFGCDLRPADPALGLPEHDTQGCCGTPAPTQSRLFVKKETTSPQTDIAATSTSYYQPDDLKKFGAIGTFQQEFADKFFDYYGAVFREGALTAREKSLIALAVAHAVQCPYCIDAYTTDTVAKGYSNAQLMEAVHVAAAIRGGATLVHGVQMMNKVADLSPEPVITQNH